jgi:filamentous hemagglutinin family protein
VTPNVEIKGVGSEVIDGGTIRASNLFHSFSEFNIQNGRGAYFTNPEGITNIFSRITGNNPSNINGILGVLGNANLFLLNPNGIIFGPNARLDLNGSFLASTASSISFADGSQFSATNPQATPLLTVSVPMGLGLGNNPGTIRVQGTGHRLILPNPFAPVIGAGSSPTGLQVKPGRTLALIGGDIALEGGILTASQGQIELGSGASGQVSFSPTGQGWTFDYTDVQSFRDIRLAQQALADVLM